MTPPATDEIITTKRASDGSGATAVPTAHAHCSAVRRCSCTANAVQTALRQICQPPSQQHLNGAALFSLSRR